MAPAGLRGQVSRCAAALGCGVLLAGCAGLPRALKLGQSVDEVQQRHGRPSADYVRPDGGRKLEYASQPSSRHTYMLHFDAQGRLQRWEDVLDEEHFSHVRPGMTTRQLREHLGPPSMEWHVRYHDQVVWTYRFQTSLCIVFHVGVTPQGIVEDSGYGPDERCEKLERF